MKEKWILDAENILGVKLNVGNRNNDLAADGPCPVCGGSDRLLVYRNTGFAYCTHSDCGFKKWLYGKPNNDSIKESFSLLSKDRAIILDRFRHIDWQDYHLNYLSSERAINLWNDRSMSIEDCSTFGLGYAENGPDHIGKESLTIPIFFRQRLVDIRHRFIEVVKKGKYSSHFPKLLPFPYNGDGVFSKSDLLLVEGEIKAIHFLKNGVNAVGFPGKNMGSYCLATLAPYLNFNQRWTIAFDPEEDTEVEARIIGSRLLQYGVKDVRICFFPLKPDDFLIRYGLELSKKVILQSIKLR